MSPMSDDQARPQGSKPAGERHFVIAFLKSMLSLYQMNQKRLAKGTHIDMALEEKFTRQFEKIRSITYHIVTNIAPSDNPVSEYQLVTRMRPLHRALCRIKAHHNMIYKNIRDMLDSDGAIDSTLLVAKNNAWIVDYFAHNDSVMAALLDDSDFGDYVLKADPELMIHMQAYRLQQEAKPHIESRGVAIQRNDYFQSLRREYLRIRPDMEEVIDAYAEEYWGQSCDQDIAFMNDIMKQCQRYINERPYVLEGMRILTLTGKIIDSPYDDSFDKTLENAKWIDKSIKIPPLGLQ